MFRERERERESETRDDLVGEDDDDARHGGLHELADDAVVAAGVELVVVDAHRRRETDAVVGRVGRQLLVALGAVLAGAVHQRRVRPVEVARKCPHIH